MKPTPNDLELPREVPVHLLCVTMTGWSPGGLRYGGSAIGLAYQLLADSDLLNDCLRVA